jgi:hypothetical protein
MKYKLFAMILLASSLTSLAACQTMPARQTCQAVKPALKSIQKNGDGGISIDRNDTEALMIYIKQLQACVR